MSIGENIRYLRKKAGLTQKQLAEKVGVNEVTIRSYEIGKYEPKTETLHKLVKALNCNINEIIDEPFILPNFSMNDLEEIADGVMIDKNAPEELKQRLKKQFSKHPIRESSQRTAFLNYLNSLGYEIVDGSWYDAPLAEIGMIRIEDDNIEIPLTQNEFETLEKSVENNIELEIYRLRKEKNI